MNTPLIKEGIYSKSRSTGQRTQCVCEEIDRAHCESSRRSLARHCVRVMMCNNIDEHNAAQSILGVATNHPTIKPTNHRAKIPPEMIITRLSAWRMSTASSRSQSDDVISQSQAHSTLPHPSWWWLRLFEIKWTAHLSDIIAGKCLYFCVNIRWFHRKICENLSQLYSEIPFPACGLIQHIGTGFLLQYSVRNLRRKSRLISRSLFQAA